MISQIQANRRKLKRVINLSNLMGDHIMNLGDHLGNLKSHRGDPYMNLRSLLGDHHTRVGEGSKDLYP